MDIDPERHAETQAADASTVADRIGEKPGDKIGRYRLLEKIGEGGFGVVFAAEQQQPVRRRVAIKVIKLGMDTREVVARFEAERQALAMMDHPNIAKVFDAGSTETGRPYFVMELVRGSAVTDYADKHRLGTNARVALAVQICRAVQHAHGKGVIHRDIKPSNVLVTVTDDKPVPKVIDFGIAKATQTRLAERTLYTAHRQLIGTPQYMSPEQADSDGSDIDTRTDVYSLGVVLYELLVGVTPHDALALRSAAYDEMRRLIRNSDVPRPGTRLLTLGANMLDTVAANRSMDLKKLNQSVKGELDWIVMKALEKDRTRRYETAAAMADDLYRYLAGEAVLAGPVSHLYRMQTLARRYKAAFVAATAAAAVLMVGIGGTTWGLVRESRLRTAAVASEHKAIAAVTEAEKQKAAAMSAQADAVEQKKSADAVVAFLTDTFALASPNNARDDQVGQVLVRNLIEPAMKTIDHRFQGQPLVRATVQATLARTLFDLGRYDLGLPEAKAAWNTRRMELGDNDPGTITAMVDFGNALCGLGRNPEAVDISKSAWERARQVLGEDHAVTIMALNSYGRALYATGRCSEAADAFERALDSSRRIRGDDDSKTVMMMMNYSVALDSLGRHAEAAEVGKQVWDQRRRMLGDDHPDTIRAMDNYANDLNGLGRSAKAADLLKQAWDAARRVQGDDHPDTIKAMTNYGAALLGARRYAEARDVLKQSWTENDRINGVDQLATLGAMTNLGIALIGLRDYVDAEPALQKASDSFRRVLPDHPFRGIALYNLGKCLVAERKWKDAEIVLRENWSWDKTREPDEARRKMPNSLRLLNDCLQAQGKPMEPMEPAAPASEPTTSRSDPSLRP